MVWYSMVEKEVAVGEGPPRRQNKKKFMSDTAFFLNCTACDLRPSFMETHAGLNITLNDT